MTDLIITNGDLAAAGLEKAGHQETILPWRDVLHEGPVPEGMELEQLSAHRARFLAHAFSQPLDPILEQIKERDGVLRRLKPSRSGSSMTSMISCSSFNFLIFFNPPADQPSSPWFRPTTISVSEGTYLRDFHVSLNFRAFKYEKITLRVSQLSALYLRE